MLEKIEGQEYQWVLRVYDWYYDGEEDQQYEDGVFATEEEALERLKEEYESRPVYCDFSTFEGHKAVFTTRDYRVALKVVKEKTNYLDMTIEEYYDKISFNYGSKQGLTSSAEAYETPEFYLHLDFDEKWLMSSPYASCRLQFYQYAPHPDDCCFRLVGCGFTTDCYGKSYCRNIKMSEVLQDMKNDYNEYYTAFLSNVKKITDMGGKYLLDINWQSMEFYYMMDKKDEFNIDFDGRFITITAKVKDLHLFS